MQATRTDNGEWELPAGRPAPKLLLLKTRLVLKFACCCFFSFCLIGVWPIDSAVASAASPGLNLSWTNNLLTATGPELPGGALEIWYPEAFCRKGSTDRDWSETVRRQKTVLTVSSSNALHFRTTIEPGVELLHQVTADSDGITMKFEFTNHGAAPVDLEWFQPACIRVARFTGCSQSNYIARSFIYTARGLTTLDQTRRRPESAARYHGGQVYVPGHIRQADVNPRPICADQPANGLIGCFSADGKYLLATASDSTHELFEGVYVCLHSDPHVGGLTAGERKEIQSRIYLMPNEPRALLKRYREDFPKATETSF